MFGAFRMRTDLTVVALFVIELLHKTESWPIFVPVPMFAELLQILNSVFIYIFSLSQIEWQQLSKSVAPLALPVLSSWWLLQDLIKSKLWPYPLI